jgi:hypothetical protein
MLKPPNPTKAALARQLLTNSEVRWPLHSRSRTPSEPAQDRREVTALLFRATAKKCARRFRFGVSGWEDGR